MSRYGLTEEESLHLLGVRLRAARRQAGLTAPQAAAAVGVHRSKISSIELGRATFRLGTLLKLAHVYDADLGDLMRGL